MAARASLQGPEGAEMREYLDWFLRRYPTPFARLEYCRRKYREQMAARRRERQNGKPSRYSGEVFDDERAVGHVEGTRFDLRGKRRDFALRSMMDGAAESSIRIGAVSRRPPAG